MSDPDHPAAPSVAGNHKTSSKNNKGRVGQGGAAKTADPIPSQQRQQHPMKEDISKKGEPQLRELVAENEALARLNRALTEQRDELRSQLNELVEAIKGLRESRRRYRRQNRALMEQNSALRSTVVYLEEQLGSIESDYGIDTSDRIDFNSGRGGDY